MRQLRDAILVTFVALAFFPAGVWMLIVLVGLVMQVRSENFAWSDIWEPLGFLLVSSAGLVGAFAILGFILSGRRILSRGLLGLCSLVGLLLAGWATQGAVRGAESPLFLIMFSAPFICGLVLFCAGHAYFHSESRAASSGNDSPT